MRLLTLIAITACRGRAAEPVPGPAAPPPATPPAVVASATKTVAGTTPPLGALAPGPARATVARFRARSCAATPPIDLGTTAGGHAAMAAFGPSGGLIAWTPSPKRLALRRVDHSGVPVGAPHELDVPADLDQVEGLRALDGHYLVFLRDNDFSGSSPVVTLYALVVTSDGVAVGAPLELDTGARGMIDAISPAASHGVLVYAGATPATDVNELRLVTVYVAPDGKVSQSTRDFPDPTPGARAFPRFTFSPEHAAIVLPEHILVDGELRTSASDPAVPGMLVAPTFSGQSIPVIGFTARGAAGKRRYGTLDLSGARHFEAKQEPQSAPLRPPFEELVDDWIITGQGDRASVHVLGKDIQLSFPEMTSGLDSQIVWTGEQAMVLYVAGSAVRLAPLPCS